MTRMGALLGTMAIIAGGVILAYLLLRRGAVKFDAKRHRRGHRRHHPLPPGHDESREP